MDNPLVKANELRSYRPKLAARSKRFASAVRQIHSIPPIDIARVPFMVKLRDRDAAHEGSDDGIIRTPQWIHANEQPNEKRLSPSECTDTSRVAGDLRRELRASPFAHRRRTVCARFVP
jgi:hypothetical protein